MVLMRFDPLRELDRLADQAISGARMPRTLPMEALRRGDQLVVAIDVPGINPDDVDVTVERNVVEVGARRPSLRQEGDDVIIDERPHGEFRRQLFLGDNLDPGRMTASCERGVLTLTIPVNEASKPRKVEIGSADEGRQALDTDARQQGQQAVEA